MNQTMNQSTGNLLEIAHVFATLATAYVELSKTYSSGSPKREMYEKKASYAADKAVLALEKADVWSVDALK